MNTLMSLHPSPLHSILTISYNSVRIKALTWVKDSQGLYDYESREIFKNTLRARKDCTLALSGDEVQLDSEDLGSEQEVEDLKSAKLVKIKKDAGKRIRCICIGKYFIESAASETNMALQLWLIVRSLKVATPKRVRFCTLPLRNTSLIKEI